MTNPSEISSIADSGNDFWRLLGEAIGTDLQSMDYSRAWIIIEGLKP